MIIKIQYILLLGVTLFFAACSQTTAKFLVQGTKQVAPARVFFENKSVKAERFEWDFGDGKKSTDSAAVHDYKHSGNYKVILRAFKGKKMNETTQQVRIDAPLMCLVEIETEFGTMVAELYNGTPLHRDNFIKLAEEGYFDGTLFHRVIAEFMIQGGDPKSKDASAGEPLGMGGPGYTVPAEMRDSLVHVKGALSAARMGDAGNPLKASSGSQFYIVQGKVLDATTLSRIEMSKGIHYTPEQKELYMSVGGTPFLDREYTVFGRVIKGLDVLDKIAAVQKDPRDRPLKDIKMKIQIIK